MKKRTIKTNEQQAVIAVNRFGLGARPGELRSAVADPRGWLKQQLHQPQLNYQAGSTEQAFKLFAEFRQRKQNEKQQKGQNSNQTNQSMMGIRKPLREFYRGLLQDSLSQSITTTAPLSMRLLDFFSNHFSVSATNARMRLMAPLLEREAIAPNLFGQFEDMLTAVEQHPAMLIYLNNEASIGPDSRLGKRRKKRGLNENLAREILELHTLGVNGGYQLQDIQELAMAITGWSITRLKDRGEAGFMFRPYAHQPGTRTLLDERYSQQGQAQGEAMLKDLARHPATARFVSYKLAQHFVSDQPPEVLVKAMTQTWLDTDGNLKAVITSLINHEAAWQIERQKFKTPREFVVSALRALDLQPRNGRLLIASLTSMGQEPFKSGSPAGYSLLNDAWSGSDALMTRVDWIAQVSKTVGQRASQAPQEIAQQVFAGQLSPQTRLAVAGAESASQGLALLLLSPEFLRR